jgi:C1A family cysteine protease
MKRRYTWKPDLPDHRDFLFESSALALPPAVDLRPQCPPVFDQGQLGSCTGNALAGAMGFLHRKLLNDETAFSRLFIYYNERVIEGTVRQDAGAMIRDGVKSLANSGVCSETDWPYNIAKFKTKPSKKCFTDAAANKIAVYTRLSTLDDMLQCLAAGFPFVFGFTVYDAFESDAVARTGVLNLPAKGEQVLGGHAVMAVGYDMAAQRLIVRNSWGSGWGQAGYFTMPFAYVTNRNLSDDFWTLRK